MTKPKAPAKAKPKTKTRIPRVITTPAPLPIPVIAVDDFVDPAILHASRVAAEGMSAPLTTVAAPVSDVVVTAPEAPIDPTPTVDSVPMVSVAVTVPPPATVDVSVANPKKKVSFEFELIDEIKHFYKITSLYFIVLLGCSGDLYNLAITSGLITAQTTPPILMKALHWIAFTTAVIRMMKLNVSKTEGSTTTTTTVNS
jgi:hypothetical protein